MESSNGALYWTGCAVEADINLCGKPGGISVRVVIVDSEPVAIAAFVIEGA
jgi:hypothetical protein